jgi:hypothetical protein
MPFQPSIDRRIFLSAALGLTTTLMSAPRLASQSIEPSIRSDKLSLDRMIGEMIVIGFQGSDAASPGVRVVCEWLNRGAVGGVIFFEDNLLSPHAIIDIIQAFREAGVNQYLSYAWTRRAARSCVFAPSAVLSRYPQRGP